MHREEYDEVPPRVEYSLTDVGTQLNEALEPPTPGGGSYTSWRAAGPGAALSLSGLPVRWANNTLPCTVARE